MTRLFTVLILLLLQNFSFGQRPCGAGGDSPQFACLTCGSGYVGNTGGYSSDNVNYNFPCGTIENSQWISFEADGTSVQVDVISGNCQNGNGVEAAIYTQQLQRISNCYTSGGVNMFGNLSATGLTPGQTYLIMIDGFAGDVCDIAVNISGHRVFDLPLPPGQITRTGPSELCPGIINTYEIPQVGGATDYFWSVPQAGKIVGGQGTRKIFVEWESVGGGLVRVTPSNKCYTGLSSFQTELVMPLPPVIMAPEFLCPNEFPITRSGTDFTDFGTYTVNFNTSGCDTLVTYTFLPKNSDPVVVNQTICPGECIQVGDSCYTTPGTQIIVLDTPQLNGCDSLVSLTINVLDSLTVNNFPDTLFCIDTCTAIMPDIVFSGQNLMAEWTTVNGSISQSSGLSVTVCSGGDYNLRLTDTLTGLFCDLQTHVTGDTIAIDSLRQITVTGGPCTSDIFTLSTDLLPNANGYNWQLPASASVMGSAIGNSIQITFSDAFDGDICVEAFNTCETSNLLCANVTVSSAPSSDFDSPGSVCISETAVLNYSGNASNSADFSWDFGGGTIVNNSGSTNYEINFPSVGNYNITLSVTENGCTSTVSTKTIRVENPVDAAVISCIADDESITFSWDDVSGATSYSAVSISGQSGNMTGNEYSVTGLTLGDSVTVEVSAIGGGACPPTVSTLRCGTQDCPNITLSVQNTAFCENAQFPSPLSLNITGGTGMGTAVWNGQYILRDGSIDPDAPAGNYTADVIYTERGCDFTAIGNAEVLPVPEVTANVMSPVWIPGISGNIDLTINSAFAYNVAWSNGSTDEDLINVPADDYSVSVTDVNGCETEEDFILTPGNFFVQPIQIICEGTSTTLFVSPSSGATFEWSPSVGLDCNDCPNPVASPTQTTTYTVTATLPNGQSESTTVEIIVVPFSVCPNSRAADNDNFEAIDFTPEIAETIGNQNISAIEKEQILVDLFSQNEIEIFPNPTSGEINIHSGNEIRFIEIFDLTGKRLQIKENTNSIDISIFPKGTYIFKITNEQQTVVKRIVKN